MNLTIILTIIIPLIERATEGLNNLALFKKVDARITAAVIGIIAAILLKIDLITMSGFLTGVLVGIPAWIFLVVSGYILSLGANAVNWLFNQVNINKDTTTKNIKDSQASPS